MLLTAKNLTKYFDADAGFLNKRTHSVKALQNISFEVIEGETLGIVGESGCGKTTLGRIIAGIIRPSSGKITFSEKIKNPHRDIQLVSQHPDESLDPIWTIGDSIIEPLLIHHMRPTANDRLEKVLKRVHLKPDILKRRPHECSGGQRQRVCIARAIILEPRILICDEPTSQLDLSIQAQILNLLLELKTATGLTLIFISHDLNVVKRICDRILVMHSGIIVEKGTTDAVTGAPSHPYTRYLLNPRKSSPWP